MSHTPHDLAEEFPHATERLATLKRTSAHFNMLAERYRDVNRAIHRMETRVEPVSDVTEYGLRRERMMLKDQISAMLAPTGFKCTG
ncbi:MAG: DUF465 domain-containing protein [Pseudomonadota bacterium]